MHLASTARDELGRLHRSVEALDVDASNVRMVPPLLTVDLYTAGSAMVLNAVLAVQHLCADIEGVKGYEFGGDGVLDRLSRAASEAGILLEKGSSEYAGWKDLVEQRRAIEHPTQASLSSGADPTRWDTVPTAWMLSEKSLRSFDRFRRLFEQLEEGRRQLREKSSTPRRLTVQRGLRSNRQSKKPRRR